MSAKLTPNDFKHESIEEEMARKGTKDIPDWLDVKKQLTFYASYHSNPINIAIHMICIPIILWSFLLLLAHIPLSSSPPKDIAPYLTWQNNVALWYNAVYCVYFICLEPVGGLLYLPQALLSHLTVSYLATHSPSQFPTSIPPFSLLKGKSSLQIAGIAQLVGWLSQFAGHGVAEGRAPALLDNLLQAVVLAPFFSHLEFLFLAFNYNPKLQAEIKEGVRQDKEKRRIEKAKKSS